MEEAQSASGPDQSAAGPDVPTRSGLDQLRALLVAAGPAGLRAPDPGLSAASCLLVASMLIDAELAEFVATGVHPASGVSSAGPMSDRFSAQVRDLQRRVGGTLDAEQDAYARRPGFAGVPPWAAASQLSWTAPRGQEPTRYLWHSAWRHRHHLFDRITRAVRVGRPTLLYVGAGWLPRHVIVVAHSDPDTFWCFEPTTGTIQTISRPQFVGRAVDMAGFDRPSFVVLPTGRRANA